MNLFFAAGLIVVIITVIAISVIWYKKHQSPDPTECEQEPGESTMFSLKMNRLQKRLNTVKHQINCLLNE